MKRYESYKDSGVKWLGEIPSHWEVVPMKYYTNIIMGQSPDGSQVKDSGTTLFMQGNSEFGSKTPSPTLYCDNCKKHSRVGDILMSVRAPVGATNISDKVYGIGRGLCSIRANSVSRNYLWYYLKVCQLGFKELSKGSTFESVSVDDIKSLTLLMPHAIEQDAIADYLNDIVSRIDSVISQQQKMIDLLNERKQIIINNAVTKGLNPNASMKDSGIDWIGQIPSQWDVKRGKFLFRIVNDLSKTGEEELLSVSDKTGVTPRSMKNVNMFMAESLVGYKKCKVGDICSNIMWMWHGAVGVSRYEGVISPSYGVFRQIGRYYHNDYLDLMLRLPRIVKLYSVLSTGLTESRLRLYPSDFLGIYFMVPPIEEQKKIVEYVRNMCNPLDSTIDNIEKQISLLQERKQIIINDVVTGKVKVI